MTFTNTQKGIIDDDATKKQITIHFPNGERADITNSEIYMEEFYLEESLLDQYDAKFGKCNGSLFNVKVASFKEDITGAEIEVKCTFSNDDYALMPFTVPIGKFIVKNADRTSDRRFKIIMATDFMTKFDVDIADWYNNVLFFNKDAKLSVNEILRQLCDYVGVEYDHSFTFMFGTFTVGKTLNPTTLSARSLLEQICEFNACFGHFNENGVLSFIKIEEQTFLYPSESLYPSENLYPAGGDESNFEYVTLYKNCDYKDYDTVPIDGVTIRNKDGNIIGSFKPSRVTQSENAYNIVNNSFMWNLDKEIADVVAFELFNIMNNLYFRPCEVSMKGGIYLQLGKLYNITVNPGTGDLRDYENFDSIVLKRVITGIQDMTSTLSAETNEYVSETYNNEDYVDGKINDCIVGTMELLGRIGILGDYDNDYQTQTIDIDKSQVEKYRFVCLELSSEGRGMGYKYNSNIFDNSKAYSQTLQVDYIRLSSEMTPNLYAVGIMVGQARLQLDIRGLFSPQQTIYVSVYGIN